MKLRRGGGAPPHIGLVEAPSFGLEQSVDTAVLREWRGDSSVMSVNFFARAPDLARPVGDDVALHAQFRSSEIEGGFAVVESGWVEVAGAAAARVIVKFPMNPHGMAYAGSLVIPFAVCSWVVKFQAAEVGVTGIREAVVLDRHLAGGGSLDDWGIDRDAPPLGPGERVAPQVGPADAPEWDATFPDHPLSQVRRALVDLRTSIAIADEARRLDPFE